MLSIHAILPLLCPLGFAPAAAPGAFLGGSDDCSTPVPIAGPGTWPFDLTSATTGSTGQGEHLCAFPGGRPIHWDVWFEWTATATGTAILRTCGMTTVDTKVAVYPGSGCPAALTALACNDDTCGQQSEITWDAVAGAKYTIQLGTWPGAQPGTGGFEILAGGAGSGSAFCFCVGAGTCNNSGDPGNGCGNGSFPGGANLAGSGAPIVSSDSFVLSVTDATPSQPGLFFQGLNAINGGNGVPFGDGLRCAGAGVVRLQVRIADPSGATQTTVAIAAEGGVAPGDVRHYQFWYRDPQLSPCGLLFNLTNGWTVTWL